jgi:hypothetical protein
MWEMLCWYHDLRAINAEKRQFGGTIDAEINNVIYMELYSGLTLSVRTEYIYSVASQATSPAPFKYLVNKYPY